MDRKKVNDEIERIIRQYEPALRNCPGHDELARVFRSMVGELQAHVDATVEAALGHASGDGPIAALDAWLIEHGYSTGLST